MRDHLPLIALILGGATVLIGIAFGVRATYRATREHNAKWKQLTDPNRCWDCGGTYHYPCPETTWWRKR